MERRTVLGLIAGASSWSALTIGSGAFSVARVDREMTVSVTHDAGAYLGLRQLGSGHRSSVDGTPDQVEFAFPSHEEGDVGLGVDSVYEFASDADESGSDATDGLLEITNQGTNPVEIWSEQGETDGPTVELFDVTDDRTSLREDPPALAVGDGLRVGFRIDTHGAETGETYDETLTIVAEATDD